MNKHLKIFYDLIGLMYHKPGTATQDKAVGQARMYGGPSAGLIHRSNVYSSVKFGNFLFNMDLPYGDSVCQRKQVDGIFCRTTPVDDADYAGLGIGSLALFQTITSQAVTEADWYIKKGDGFAKIQTGGAIANFDENGVCKASYTTLALAVAALEAGDIIKLGPGEHEANEIDITEPGWCKIVGEPGATIKGAVGADYCLRTVFGAISSTKGIDFENVRFDHGDDATQVGIDCANASATGRINLTVRNCSFESDGGDSLYTLHTSTSASIRWYISDCDFEGPVEFTVGNTDDRVRLERCDLIGGLVTGTAATAMEIYLGYCKILHEGVTGGNNAQLMYAMYCLSATDTNPEVYAALDTNDLAGSQNETVLFPTS